MINRDNEFHLENDEQSMKEMMGRMMMIMKKLLLLMMMKLMMNERRTASPFPTSKRKSATKEKIEPK